MVLISDSSFMKFEQLWDRQSLIDEIVSVFGEFDESRWNLDSGTTANFDEFMKTGRPLDEYYASEQGFVYQSCWNAATNDERTKYLTMKKFALENGFKSVLEYGCGIGSGAVTLAMAGIDVTAVDVCEPCLNFLKARRKRFELDNLKVLNVNTKGRWNWRNNTYDMIVCTEVFEHVEQPIELAKQLYDVLNPGGGAIFSWSFVNMPTHLPQHFHLQHRHPDDVINEGFGKILVEEIGYKYAGNPWFNNYAFRKGES
jgi:2-polyprenyl-3-methyl-5-hydroxy-6-metoxy-1,4-benzoquinol methylase